MGVEPEPGPAGDQVMWLVRASCVPAACVRDGGQLATCNFPTSAERDQHVNHCRNTQHAARQS